MTLGLREVLNDFLSLVYPECCISCQDHLVKGEEIICTRCILDLPKCNFIDDPNNTLALKFKGRIHLNHALAFLKFRKKSRVQRLLHALKYQGHREIGYKLGRVYGEELVKAGIGSMYDMITTVPLHDSRLKQRGYNQSDEWARGISESTGITFAPNLLARRHKTETQTKRTKMSRWENVKEIFFVQKPESILGKRVLLADDVVTTGATLESCGQTLLEGFCDQIGIVCLAATV